MIKIKITSTRFAEAANILDYLSIIGGNRDTALRLIPRFILDKDGEYVVKVKCDEDGDIQEFENLREATMQMTAITPKRSERLVDEMLEAAKSIVNPPKEGG